MKRLRYESGDIDAIDAAILRALAEEARVTMADLARRVGLSAPSVTERVRRLEEAGIVRGYGAWIDPAALGLPLAAYIRVRPMPGQLRKTIEVLQGLEAVVECDRVTGEDCFVAKAQLRSVEAVDYSVHSGEAQAAAATLATGASRRAGSCRVNLAAGQQRDHRQAPDLPGRRGQGRRGRRDPGRPGAARNPARASSPSTASGSRCWPRQ